MQIGFVVNEGPGIKSPRPWARMGEKVVVPDNYPVSRAWTQHWPQPAVVEAKKHIQKAAYVAMRKADLRKPTEDAVEVFMVFFFVKPPSRIKKHSDPHPFPTVKADIDNLAKLILDSLTSIVYKDDQYVVETHCYKRYILQGPAHTFVGVKTMQDIEAQNPLTVEGNTCRGFAQFYPKRGKGF